MSKLTKIVLIIVAIVILCVSIVEVARLTNNFQGDFKTFYLVVDGKKIYHDTTNMDILDKPIELHNIVGNNEFSYKIIARKSEDFVFMLDGIPLSINSIDDYTPYFDIGVEDNCIVVKKISLFKLLKNIYGDGNLVFPNLDKNTCYFTLVITSNNKTSISIDFFVDIFALGIELDQSNVWF